jgi:hypothetical protein
MKTWVEFHYQPRTASTAHSPVRVCSSARTAHIKPRRRGEMLRTMGHVLLIGRELLLAFWAIAVLTFCLVVIAGCVL